MSRLDQDGLRDRGEPLQEGAGEVWFVVEDSAGEALGLALGEDLFRDLSGLYGPSLRRMVVLVATTRYVPLAEGAKAQQGLLPLLTLTHEDFELPA